MWTFLTPGDSSEKLNTFLGGSTLLCMEPLSINLIRGQLSVQAASTDTRHRLPKLGEQTWLEVQTDSMSSAPTGLFTLLK